MPDYKPQSNTGQVIGGVAIGLVIAGFGLFWTITAFTITAGSPFPGVHTFFPLFGLIFVVVGILVAVGTVSDAGHVNRVGTIDTSTSTRVQPPNSPAASGTPAKKSRSLVHCECGEPFRVGGRFCTRCGTAVEGIST